MIKAFILFSLKRFVTLIVTNNVLIYLYNYKTIIWFVCFVCFSHQLLLVVILISSGTVGFHSLPIILGNVICGVLIVITSGREKCRVRQINLSNVIMYLLWLLPTECTDAYTSQQAISIIINKD